MERFVIRTKLQRSSSESCNDNSDDSGTPSAKRSCNCQTTGDNDSTASSSTATDASSRMKSYKSKLRYNPEWRVKWSWIEYDDTGEGMLCSLCKRFGKPPTQAHGAWVTRPICNWVKATELLAKHEKSDWHRASVEASAMAEMAKKQGDIIEQMRSASEEEKRKNRALIMKLIRSLYFLVKHRIPHTTTFQDLITLQIENGNEQLKVHLNSCPSNASYLSKVTTAELLRSISDHIEEKLLCRLKESQYFSILADESTDIASKEELSICGRWLEMGKPVEHFLGMVHIKEVDAKSITEALLHFLRAKGIDLKKLRGLGFDGASTMSGCRSGVQLRMRCCAPSSLYIHCHCHRLQLAAVNAAREHREVSKVFGTLLTMWKAFHYSPKKAEKLIEIQAILNSPELKVTKPSDTRWLARERCVRSVRQCLPALIRTFEELYEENGDAEAYGLSRLLCTYKFVACLYMLCDILHTVAKLQAGLQAKELDLASIPVLVDSTLSRLIELKEDPSSTTWFKDHKNVFTDPNLLGERDIEFVISDEQEQQFIMHIYRPYIQSVIDRISSRLKSSDLVSAFSIFDPRHLPEKEEELATYGEETLKQLTDFYGKEQRATYEDKTGVSHPDIVAEQAEAEWKIFRRVMFVQFRSTGLENVTSNLLTNPTLCAGFPNLVRLASLSLVLPVTTATVERSFSDMKLTKTRLRSRLGEDTLDQTLRLCIEGSPTLLDGDLDSIVKKWKQQKPRRLVI